VKLAVVADAYPPMKTSGAVQIRDLVSELIGQGHQVTVLLPDASLPRAWEESTSGNLQVMRLKAMAAKDVSYTRRAIAEHLLSGFMLRNYLKSPLRDTQWDGIIWYSPSIFFGRFIGRLKAISRCRAYLILRDIFPEWAVDMGLLKRGIIYRYFKAVEKLQYRQASTIGIQTPSVTRYFDEQHSELDADIEVLNNWLAPPNISPSSIQLTETVLAGKKVFVYTGNIGIAQGMDILIELAANYKSDDRVGFLFVGRGTAVEYMKKQVVSRQLDNVLIRDEIDPNEIPSLLSQCEAGLIALDPRHRHDNIPGKFLAYMQAGLPVLATINPGNDLETLINEIQVGRVITSNRAEDLKAEADALLASLANDDGYSTRCKTLAESRFSSRAAVQQIVAALKG